MPDLNAELRAQLARAAAANRPTATPTTQKTPPAVEPASGSTAEAEAQARAAQARAAAQSVLFFGSTSAAAAALRASAPRTAAAVLTFSSGFTFANPLPAVRGAGVPVSRAVRPTPATALLLAPSPLGVVPPEQFGLRPDFLDLRLVPDVLRFEALNTAAEPARLAAFLEGDFKAAFQAELTALSRVPLEQLRAQIAAFNALPQEARVIGSPAQTYYAVAVETLARRERLARAVGGDATAPPAPVALFVSQNQAAQISAGELVPVPVVPLTRPQLVGAPAVPLVSGAALPPGDALAVPVVSLLPDLDTDPARALVALFPNLLQPTTTAARATEAELREGQREHFTERADP